MAVRRRNRIDVAPPDIAGLAIGAEILHFVARRGVDPDGMVRIHFTVRIIARLQGDVRFAAPQRFIDHEITEQRGMTADGGRQAFLQPFAQRLLHRGAGLRIAHRHDGLDAELVQLVQLAEIDLFIRAEMQETAVDAVTRRIIEEVVIMRANAPLDDREERLAVDGEIAVGLADDLHGGRRDLQNRLLEMLLRLAVLVQQVAGQQILAVSHVVCERNADIACFRNRMRHAVE